MCCFTIARYLSLSLPLIFHNKENFAHVLIQKVEVKVFIENDNFIHVFNVSNERKISIPEKLRITVVSILFVKNLFLLLSRS